MARNNINYFTCTLGEAAYLRELGDKRGHSFKSVLKVIDEQAKRLPGHPALGFADHTLKTERESFPDQVTFSELCISSKIAAAILADVLYPHIEHGKTPTVGVLCASSLDFILTWLGLLRLGYSAFLLAPQLEAREIQHLCEVSDMKIILVDNTRRNGVIGLSESIGIVKIPLYRDPYKQVNGPHDEFLFSNEEPDIAYIQHTSGTSSGLPKPIAQHQWGAVGCLPSFPHRSQPATFSTTPLYHGGLADCFRSWTSGASIWFFPEGIVPITATNVLGSLGYALSRGSTPVKYFSSVPYVLQLLAESPEGIYILQSMDLVGVGGASLASSTGETLVKHGVNLASRFGSTECGFLMSSHRSYASDKEWQYLRPAEDPKFLTFEPRGDGLFELIVRPDWPLITKTNRDDGSYATADLFEPHPSMPNAWRYHSRADAQIALANGKKFDPSPLEQAIKASTCLLQDVLVFGAGKEYPGALLFKASNDLSADEIINRVWPEMQVLNKKIQSHSRLSKSMLIVIESEGEENLAKSSKGTILRRQAETRYADVIERAYSSKASASKNTQNVSDAEIPCKLLSICNQILAREINPHEDLFQQGVDSIACIQIRKLTESSILSQESLKLPTNIIYDSGTLDILGENLIRLRHGKPLRGSPTKASDLRLMLELSEKYSNFAFNDIKSIKKDGEVVVLTGATGALGAHILSSILCGDVKIRRVYCLVRGETKLASQQRVSKALSKRGLLGSELVNESGYLSGRVVCLPCQLWEQQLGLSDEDWACITDEATIFLHASWAVNFTLPLSSFERTHIRGVYNMINASVSSGSRFFFVSSTAAVSCDSSAVISEDYSSDPSHASPLGYSRSKWVGERICLGAREELSKNNSLGTASISIIRVGDLCANAGGVWNESDEFPLMLSTASLVGCLPSSNESLSWLPVDQAAAIVLEIALALHNPEVASMKTPVYHVLNFHKSPSWNQMLDWVSDTGRSPTFEVVKPTEWLRRVESKLDDPPTAGHPSQALLGLWQNRFRDETSTSEGSHVIQESGEFDVSSSMLLSQTMRELRPLSRQSGLKLWDWIQENVERKVVTDELLDKVPHRHVS
ncbi:acetyl-CoA synthetase-like protein [Hypoxylon sp. NC1633]|nr:acetyl-CoA synthetase-like protein [Hypoxylon sp. NC1633]